MCAWEFPEYPDDWDEIRRAVLIRDNFTCTSCGARDIPLHADHILSLSKGGDNSLGNLQTLCEECHQQKHPWLKTTGEISVADALYCRKCAKAYPASISFRTKFCPDCDTFLSRRPPEGNIDYSAFKKPPEILSQPALVVEDWCWLLDNHIVTETNLKKKIIAHVTLAPNVRYLGVVTVAVMQDNIMFPDSVIVQNNFKINSDPGSLMPVELSFKVQKHFYMRGYFIKIQLGQNYVQMPSSYPPRLRVK